MGEILLFDSKERDKSIDRVYRHFTALKFERKMKRQSSWSEIIWTWNKRANNLIHFENFLEFTQCKINRLFATSKWSAFNVISYSISLRYFQAVNFFLFFYEKRTSCNYEILTWLITCSTWCSSVHEKKCYTILHFLCVIHAEFYLLACSVLSKILK